MPVNILAISGSLRTGSLNTKLLKVAAEAAESAGASVTHVDLRSLDLPMYDQDLEDASGLPAGCITLKDQMKAHHGMLIASPEYNSSYTGALKNAIDWASRPRDGEKPLECFAGKTAGLIACSPGALGGLRGLVTLRMLLGNIQVHVLPKQYAAGSIEFNDDGKPTNDDHTEGVSGVARELVSFTASVTG
ncbi:MAG: NAD(P)H-dependent oxidoreductase [Planctomycetota bacterium]